MATLGLRSMAYRPGRSILCVTPIASATSGLPLIYDPNTPAGRDAWNLAAAPTRPTSARRGSS
jgi:hypothetical protein